MSEISISYFMETIMSTFTHFNIYIFLCVCVKINLEVEKITKVVKVLLTKLYP